jgi:sugar lactone lactonase YvrE
MRPILKSPLYFLAILTGCLIFLSSPALSEESYRFERMWPTLLQPWYFNHPSDLAIDNNGFIYVVDHENHFIQKFTLDGQFVAKWGSEGKFATTTEVTADGILQYPDGIAIDNKGVIYVADALNNRIQKFTADGQFVAKWGSEGTGDSQFNLPSAIAIDKNGFVYVADTNNHRIQRFTVDGEFVAKWGSEGSDDAQFNEPKGVAIDINGFVYIADHRNNRIQKFTLDGEFIGKWGSEGIGNGQFRYPEGIALDNNGFVYVTDRNNHRIQKFTSDGEFIGKWGNQGSASSQFQYPEGIAIDSDGSVYIADAYNHCVQKFTSDGQFVARWGSQGSGVGQFRSPGGVVLHNNGFLYVADTDNNRIQKFMPDGQTVYEWGSYGENDGQFKEPKGIAVDINGFIYVADYGNKRIQKFTSDGEFISKWGSQGDGDGQFMCPDYITVDINGFVYVCDCANNIQKFTSDGQFVTGDYGGNLNYYPYNIAADHNGFIYVTTLANRIYKFSSGGDLITTWGNPGSDDGQLYIPWGITVDSRGLIYIADGKHRIQKFSPSGEFIGSFGKAGCDPGYLHNPIFLSASIDGKVYVSDVENNRLQIFRAGLPTDKKMKALIVVGGSSVNNGIWDATQVNANLAYRALSYQGLTKDEIYYLSENPTGEGNINASPTADELQQSITNWANDADRFVIYLTDHGGNGTFRLNSGETLSASELDSWLDTLQENTDTEVTVIYDACQSGSFVPSLTPPPGKKRTVIASSASDEPAYFISKGAISFSNYFWTRIFAGDDIKEAFEFADQAMGGLQHAVIDVNGNGIGNESGETDMLRSIYIGNGTDMYPQNPVTATVSSPQTVSGTDSALLYASGVTDKDGIARVWAVICPPENAGPADKPVTALPELDLLSVGNDRYENTYDGFHTNGTYRIAIYAMDRIGYISAPTFTTVEVANPPRRKAVIVAGGPGYHEFWPAAENIGVSAYEALKSQGYEDDDIYFMSPVTFSAGVDGLPSLSNLEYAVGGWTERNGWDLVIYMMGKDQAGDFQISETESLSPAAFDQWLDKLQETLPGSVTVVYDACRSGVFLSSLTAPEGKERFLISGASGEQCASFSEDGAVSFSAFFWERISEGMNIRDAFVWSQQAVKYLGRCSGEDQIPALDDNGNGIFNEKSDGRLAKDHTIGSGVVLEMNIPVIGSVSPYQILNGETSAAISAENVTATGTIDKVLAVIVPPGGMPSGTTELPTIELLPAGDGRYEGIYQDFTRKGIYRISVYATETDGDISQPKVTEIEQTVGTEEPAFSGGVFTAGETGIFQAEYLYDGGSYEGELSVFSLAGMEEFPPGSPEFIREAARRAVSDSELGHIIVSDPAEGARFDGSVSSEGKMWNSGWFRGEKSLQMNPGEQFAMMLVPNAKTETLLQNPGTADSAKRPLFSLVSPNTNYGMNMGQIADVDGRGGAFVFEDMEISRSDRDYDDLIFRITGASADNIPSMDSLLTGDMPDWRKDTELGELIMTHLEICETDMPRLSVTMSGTADLLAYDSAGKVIGKEGGDIPGSLFGIDDEGRSFISLPLSEDGADSYRLVLRSAVAQTCELTATTYFGDTEISSETITVAIEDHQVLKADVPVLAFGDGPSVEFGEFEIPTDADGNPLFHDFDGDGDIDDEDIARVYSLWNICEGDPLFDPFYDLDDDGCITILDITPVVNSKYVP